MNHVCTTSLVSVNSKTNAQESTTQKSVKKMQPVKGKRPAPQDILEIVKDFKKKEGAHLEMSVITTIILCLKHQRIMNYNIKFRF